MSRRLILTSILIGLGLTACGAVGNAANAVSNRAQSAYYRHMTCQSTYYSGLAWATAPDGSGTRIYYTIFDGTTSRFNLRVMDGQGGDDHLLVPDAGAAAVSPDVRWLLYQALSTSGPNATQFGLLDLQSMTISKPGDLGPIPRWSAGTGSKSIVYALLKPSEPIRRLDIASGKSTIILKPLDKAVYGDGYPWPSPDGKRIAFLSDRDGPVSIYVMDADPAVPGSGKGVTRLKGQDEPACGGTWENRLSGWSPDGKQVAYIRTCDQRTTLNVLPLDAAKPSWSFDGFVYGVAWSPDGGHILISAQTDPNKLPELLVGDAADPGSSLTSVRSGADSFAWSPDSKRIAFVEFGSNKLVDIYSMALDGTDVRQLTHNPGAGVVCPH